MSRQETDLRFGSSVLDAFRQGRQRRLDEIQQEEANRQAQEAIRLEQEKLKQDQEEFSANLDFQKAVRIQQDRARSRELQELFDEFGVVPGFSRIGQPDEISEGVQQLRFRSDLPNALTGEFEDVTVLDRLSQAGQRADIERVTAAPEEERDIRADEREFDFRFDEQNRDHLNRMEQLRFEWEQRLEQERIRNEGRALSAAGTRDRVLSIAEAERMGVPVGSTMADVTGLRPGIVLSTTQQKTLSELDVLEGFYVELEELLDDFGYSNFFGGIITGTARDIGRLVSGDVESEAIRAQLGKITLKQKEIENLGAALTASEKAILGTFVPAPNQRTTPEAALAAVATSVDDLQTKRASLLDAFVNRVAFSDQLSPRGTATTPTPVAPTINQNDDQNLIDSILNDIFPPEQ